ncbi:ABC transporter substrate-binding protein [Aquabacterium sp.]|uniref:ABC transporter substrate-binding protein n=1 Tax=Aquabacterium sp. TaxID=1872578 RepID=UPI0027B9966C|nr:ABC transporter substrate binding protein [Aquabacterium sp.]
MVGVGQVQAASDAVWVLPSDASWAYTEAATALQADWRQVGRGRELLILGARELPSGAPPAALVTLGAAALRLAMERASAQADWARVPVLGALLPRDGFAAVWKRPPAWVSAAYLDQPIERYLALIRRAMPRLTKVGVLVHEDAVSQRQALLKAAQAQGVRLVIGSVGAPETLSAALRSVLADADVLLILPDSAVADVSALQHMLITAYRQRVPVVSYSPALVKAGAAMGLYASPAQAGRQVAAMLKGPLSASSGVSAWPAARLADGFTVALNEQVCRSLGLDVPDVSVLTDALRREEGMR